MFFPRLCAAAALWLLALSSCKGQQPAQARPAAHGTSGTFSEHVFPPDRQPEAWPDSLLPSPMGRIADFEDVLRDKHEERLYGMLLQTDSAYDCQIGLTTIDPTRTDADFDTLSVQLFNHWGVGDSVKNNGILISVSHTARKMRVTTGRGVEGRLTDQEAAEVVQSALEFFRMGDYAGGFEDAILRIRERL